MPSSPSPSSHPSFAIAVWYEHYSPYDTLVLVAQSSIPYITICISKRATCNKPTMSAAVIALATALAIVVILASVLISLMYVRLRQKHSYDGAVESSPLTPGFGIFKFIPPWHPAAQITPFGSSPQAPVFSEPNSPVI